MDLQVVGGGPAVSITDAALPEDEILGYAPPVTYRVLLIDDDPGTIETYGFVLRRAGFTVDTATEGAAGLDRARSTSFDLIVADLRLPDLGDDGGLQILRTVRGTGVLTPFVVMTMFPDISMVVEAMRLGASDFIDKNVLDPSSAVQRILAAIRASSDPGASSALDPRVGEVMRIIKGELGKELSLRRLAGRVRLSPSRLRHLFYEQTGTSISVYRRRLRLETAADLLRHTRTRSSEVAYAVGFNSVSAFVRAFRGRFGLSPSEFRRGAR